MAGPWGFDFRSTLGFPLSADPAFCSFCNGSIAYQTTFSNGLTGGWAVAADGDLDRVNSVDPRLTGVVFSKSGAIFQADLPAPGDYDLHLAFGDAANGNGPMSVQIYDGTTLVHTLGPDTTSGGDFYDATDTLRLSAADWAANEVAVRKTFATQLLKLVFPVQTNYAEIAHLFISQVQKKVPGSLLPVMGVA